MRFTLLLLAIGFVAAPAGAEGMCLRVEAEGRPVAAIPAAVGDEVRLRFRHSIYGSQVEEHFRVARDGFRSVRLRYAERRLVEFYGHETAQPAEGWWVVEGDRRELSLLRLRVSPESRIELSVGPERVPLWRLVEPAGLVHVAVTLCEGRDDAR